MKPKLSLILPVLLVSCLSACSPSQTTATEHVSANTKVKKGNKDQMNTGYAKWTEAKVVYLNFEGGFYGIVTKGGDKLLPMNLNPELRQSGAIISFKGELIKDVVTIQQWGQLIKLTEVKLIRKGSNNQNPIM